MCARETVDAHGSAVLVHGMTTLLDGMTCVLDGMIMYVWIADHVLDGDAGHGALERYWLTCWTWNLEQAWKGLAVPIDAC